MALTMFGTQAPQKLFSGIPAGVSNMPGSVTPDITAAMPSNVDWADIINAQNFQKQASRTRGWGAPEFQAQQQAQQQQKNRADEQAKYRATFDEWWAPKLQNQYHDQMLNAEGTTTAMGTVVPKLTGNTTHPVNRLSSNQSAWDIYSGRPGAEPGAAAGPGFYYKPYRMGEEQLRKQLDNMWRMQTDPYMRAVSGGLDATTLFSLGTPGKGGNMPGRRSDGGGGGGGGGSTGASYGGTTQGYAPNPFPQQSLTERTRPTVFY